LKHGTRSIPNVKDRLEDAREGRIRKRGEMILQMVTVCTYCKISLSFYSAEVRRYKMEPVKMA